MVKLELPLEDVKELFDAVQAALDRAHEDLEQGTSAQMKQAEKDQENWTWLAVQLDRTIKSYESEAGQRKARKAAGAALKRSKARIAKGKTRSRK